VQAYRAALETAGLAASSINVRPSAIRKLAAEAADNGLCGHRELQLDQSAGVLLDPEGDERLRDPDAEPNSRPASAAFFPFVANVGSVKDVPCVACWITPTIPEALAFCRSGSPLK
jgi:hypothetical protein